MVMLSAAAVGLVRWVKGVVGTAAELVGKESRNRCWVVELLGLRVLLPLLGECGPVDVAQANNGAATTCRIIGVAGALTADANAADLDPVIGAQHRSHVRESKGSGGGGSALAEEAATVEAGKADRWLGFHGADQGVNRPIFLSQCGPCRIARNASMPLPEGGFLIIRADPCPGTGA